MDVAELGIRVSTTTVPTATKQLDAMTASAGRAEMAAQDLAAVSTGRLAPGMAAGGQQSRMMAMQLSQVAQQASATGNWIQALAIQLPDMAMGFGAAGIAAGVLASVTLPLLANAFATSGAESEALAKKADQLKDALEAVEAATESLALKRQMLFSGAELEEEQRLLNEIGELTRERASLQETIAANEDKIGGKVAFYANQEARARQETAQARIAEIDLALQGLEAERKRLSAAESAKAIAETYKSIQQQIAAADISGPWNSVLGSIQSAIDKAREYAEVSAMRAIGGGRGAGPGGPLAGSGELAALQAGGGVWRNPVAPSFGGGGGGGGADTYQSKLDALVESLRSERSIEDEWYQESLAILTDRRAQELIGKQAHDKAMVSLHEEYQRRIADIDANSMQSRLSDASNMFGALAGIAEAGGRKQLKTAATLSAAATTIAGYEAAMTAAAKAPTLAGKIAAYAGWLGTAAKAVGAIKSAGGIGGGGGSFGGTSVAAQGVTAQASPMVEFRIYGLDKKRRYTPDELQEIFDGMLEEGKRRGAPTPSIMFV